MKVYEVFAKVHLGDLFRAGHASQSQHAIWALYKLPPTPRGCTNVQDETRWYKMFA